MTTAVWLLVTFLTRPTDTATLQGFYDRIRPFARGWRRAVNTQPDAPGSLAAGLAAWGLGCVTVYAVLFGTGMALYGNPGGAIGFGLVAAVAAVGLFRALPRVGFD